MLKKDVLKFFGGPAKTARALGVTHQAVAQWDHKIPERMAWRAQSVSKGRLKLDETSYSRAG